jgi:tetratricopeptide (TPR) repeat protein
MGKDTRQKEGLRPESWKEAESSPRRYLRWALAGAALTVGATVGVWLMRPSPLAFAEEDWLLVNDFENLTDDPEIGGAIRAAFEWELALSQYLRIVPQVRIEDTLRLIGRPPESRIDLELGREICVADRSIRAVLSGRIEPTGSGYALRAGLVDPLRGITVAQNTQEIADGEQLFPTISRAAAWLRGRLGESRSAVQHSLRAAGKSPRPSLPALRSCALGLTALGQGKHTAAREFLRAATEQDPGFAAAYAYLAWALEDDASGESGDEYRLCARRAFELSERTYDHERYFILGVYYWSVGESEKAFTAYKTLAELRRDHYWAVQGAARACDGQAGREHDRLRFALQAAEIRPHSVAAVWRAAEALVRSTGDWERARRYVQRATALLSRLPPDVHSDIRAAIASLPPA